MKKDSLASVDVLVAEHRKAREQISTFDPIAEELEAIDQTLSAGEWVEAKMGDTDKALGELTELLTSLHTWMIAHWRREGKEMIPFLRDSGQEKFAAKLLREHQLMGVRLTRYHHKTEALRTSHMSSEQFSTEIRTLKNGAAILLKMMGEHAGNEEKMLFQLGHAV